MSTFYDKTPSGEPLRPLFPQDFPKDIVGIVEDYLWGYPQPRNITYILTQIVDILKKVIPTIDENKKDVMKFIVDTYTENCGIGADEFIEKHGAHIFNALNFGRYSMKGCMEELFYCDEYYYYEHFGWEKRRAFQENIVCPINNIYYQCIVETFKNAGIDNIYGYYKQYLKEKYRLINVTQKTNRDEELSEILSSNGYKHFWHSHSFGVFVKKNEIDNFLKIIPPGVKHYDLELETI